MNTKRRNRGRTLIERVRHAAAGAVLMLAAACSGEPPATAVPVAPEGGMDGKYHVGYVIGANGRPEKILFEVSGNDAVVEGDIVIGRAADVPRTPEAALKAAGAGGRFSLAVSSSTRYWPGGAVPYMFASGVSATTRATADSAMDLITRRIDGVTFTETTSTASPHMRIEDDNTSGKCSATIGRTSTVSVANINGCRAGTTAHEFMHVLGFHHEQKRCDRDSYIDLTSTLGGSGGWTKECGTDVTYLGSAYDLLSVMHYDSTAGFNGSRVDLWLRNEGVDASTRVGQRDSLSNCDNYALDQVYSSTATPVCSRSYTDFGTYHTLSGYWGSERGLVVDEKESGFSMSASWGYSSGGSNPHYLRHHYHTSDSSKKGWYTFQVPSATAYNFYAWAFQKSGATTGTVVYNLYAGTPGQITSTSVPVQTWEWNQSQGLRWLYLGNASLAAGTYTLQTQKKSGTTGTIVADAIRVTQDANDPVN